MTDAPERIWLQWECEHIDHYDGVTWCRDKIEDTDVPYARQWHWTRTPPTQPGTYAFHEDGLDRWARLVTVVHRGGGLRCWFYGCMAQAVEDLRGWWSSEPVAFPPLPKEGE